MERESFEIHSEARGAHWVAWMTRRGEVKTLRSIVLVGRTREEAEASARRWAEQNLSAAGQPQA